MTDQFQVREYSHTISDGWVQRYRVYSYSDPASKVRGVVAIAPGWGGWRYDYEPLAVRLVSSGYVVGVCDFRDSENPTPEVLRQDELRVKDFHEFCVELMAQHSHGNPLHVIGHSGGAKCALGVADATYQSLGRLDPLPNLASCIALSPQGIDKSSETTGETANSVTVPVMYGTGTLDEGGRTGDPWTWRTNLYYLGTNTPRHLYVLHDATHAQVGMTGREMMPDAMLEAGAGMVLDFLGAYGERSLWSRLQLWLKTMWPPAEFERVESGR